MTRKTTEGAALPAGVLVFYDEEQGLRQPHVKLFNASAGIEGEVNEWIQSQRGLIVHRIDWVPSGGLLGASVLYSAGNRATESVRLPAPPPAGTAGDTGLQRFGVFAVMAGIFLCAVALILFTILYPTTWHGEPGALIDRDLAVKTVVLSAGIGILVTFLGTGLYFRGRLS